MQFQPGTVRGAARGKPADINIYTSVGTKLRSSISAEGERRPGIRRKIACWLGARRRHLEGSAFPGSLLVRAAAAEGSEPTDVVDRPDPDEGMADQGGSGYLAEVSGIGRILAVVAHYPVADVQGRLHRPGRDEEGLHEEALD